MLRFEPKVLEYRLSRVGDYQRSVFALLCASRLLPLSLEYCRISGLGDAPGVVAVRTELRQQLQRGVEFQCGDVEHVYKLAPNDNTPGNQRTLLDPLAENAILALGAALESHQYKNSLGAVWAAEQAYEAVDFIAQRQSCSKRCPSEFASETCDHPIVQRELNEQELDVASIGLTHNKWQANEQLQGLFARADNASKALRKEALKAFPELHPGVLGEQQN
jgi:hypothetical protein